MICRMWDVSFTTGRYHSTDFIVSDEKCNLMHCTARGNIAHNFLWLKDGAIYSVKNFTVQQNKDDFRVFIFAHFIIEMDRDTVVCNSSVRPDGFARYPFQLVEFDSLEPTNNKYLIAMSVKLYNSKPILSINFLLLKITLTSGIELAKELLLIALTRHTCFYAATFHCAVRIDKISTKRGWNYPSCGGEKCRKGNLDRKQDRFWCDSCHSYVDYPVLRYRLELEVEVSDDTAHDVEETGLPPVLANIMGTLYTLKLKSNSYYEYENYESFTCWSVFLEEALDESGSSGTLVAAGNHNTEESFVVDSKRKRSDVGCSSEVGKRKRQYGSAIKEAGRVPTTTKFNVIKVLNK
nr:hypothetical protein [Tanacetum cinerariifolium]